MRPTFSIICFTVLSGLGYGAWFLLGLLAAADWPCGPAWTPSPDLCLRPGAPAWLGPIGFVLVSAGLLCSLGHLGQPQRAWRALSQWRSSWLSREGVAALLTFLPAVALVLLDFAAAGALAGLAPADAHALRAGGMPVRALLGGLLALGALSTVVCTANIYASLKPIRAWHDRHVVPGYLLLGLYGGMLLAWLADALPGWSIGTSERRILLIGLIALALAGAWLKHRYWRSIDAQPATSAGHATGLSALGTVRSFEQPHTEDNYLTHEMGFVLARKHARKLRRNTLAAAFLLPALLAMLALAMPAIQPLAAWLALASGLAGLFVERWLFFAEAKHTVMAYYGR
ncbi:MAG: dimethyl sulfoxide reductase anchor subunit [Rhodanobacteraceae bacterium]|jgi:DMSO reductase anchor subunit|nr:dimethyl sulfoxide reductase anchor subunit [Rhodanobacteraceae bacterium]